MLTISKRQRMALQENLKNAYLRDIRRNLRQQWPDNDALSKKEWIREKADDTAFYGLTGRFAIRRYCELCLSEGEGFPCDKQYAWAQKILKDKHNTEEEKLDHIESTLTFGGS